MSSPERAKSIAIIASETKRISRRRGRSTYTVLNDNEMQAYYAIRWGLITQSEINEAAKMNWASVVGRHNSQQDIIASYAKMIINTVKIEPTHDKRDKSMRGRGDGSCMPGNEHIVCDN